MGFFSNLFGGKKNDEPKKQEVFFAEESDQFMSEAMKKARETFGYFWREQYWDRRRIISPLDIACVKASMTQVMAGSEKPVIEHMWFNQITFDGETVHGDLMNQPNLINNVKQGERVVISFDKVSDWMFSIKGRVHGAFTVQALRAKMSEAERQNHDNAWGLNFGDHNNILLAYEQEEHPENLIEHPMSKNMSENTINFFNKNPHETQVVDDEGFYWLQKEAIAGNKVAVEALLNNGADKKAVNTFGKTAYDYAVLFNWKHIIDLLK